MNNKHAAARRLLSIGALIAGGLALAACSSSKMDPFAGTGSPVYKKAGKIPHGGGRRHIGKPYKVAGLTFYPKEDPSYNKVGIASWYGKRFPRRRTANGEWYDMNYLTAAHTTMPLPSYARVTNLETGKKVVVRVNDRGPFVNDRIIDLSRKAADVLGMRPKGTAKVRVEYIGPAPLNDRGSHLAAMNRELRRGTPLDRMIAAANGNRRGTTRVAAAAARPNSQSASGYYVQLGAYGVRDNAWRARRKAQSLGHVVISPASSGFGTIWRVRIGPLSSRDQALNIQQKAWQYGHNDARVVIN